MVSFMLPDDQVTAKNIKDHIASLEAEADEHGKTLNEQDSITLGKSRNDVALLWYLRTDVRPASFSIQGMTGRRNVPFI